MADIIVYGVREPTSADGDRDEPEDMIIDVVSLIDNQELPVAQVRDVGAADSAFTDEICEVG